jgi:hypothetical protein
MWGYEGIHDRAEVGPTAVECVLAAIPPLWMPIRLRRPSQVAYWLLYLLIVVPSCPMPIYALDDQSRPASAGPHLVADGRGDATAIFHAAYDPWACSTLSLASRSYRHAFVSVKQPGVIASVKRVRNRLAEKC